MNRQHAGEIMNENAIGSGWESATEEPTNLRAGESNGQPVSWAETDHAIRTFVAERPFAAVGLALFAGYLLGRAINAAR